MLQQLGTWSCRMSGKHGAAARLSPSPSLSVAAAMASASSSARRTCGLRRSRDTKPCAHPASHGLLQAHPASHGALAAHPVSHSLLEAGVKEPSLPRRDHQLRA